MQTGTHVVGIDFGTDSVRTVISAGWATGLGLPADTSRHTSCSR